VDEVIFNNVMNVDIVNVVGFPYDDDIFMNLCMDEWVDRDRGVSMTAVVLKDANL
jgi:hypothetical protein